jgi:hypothetical protein
VDLDRALEELCPGMKPWEIDRSLKILGGSELLQHGQLPEASYDLPVRSLRDPALFTFCTALRARLRNGPVPFRAVAATQVGVTYPLVVGEDLTYLSHPYYKIRRSVRGPKDVVVMEGCGSMVSTFAYLALYPRNVVVDYVNLLSGKRLQNRSSCGYWYFEEDGYGLDTNAYVHEVNHLLGETAANGRLLWPEQVPDEAWRQVKVDFFDGLDEGYQEKIRHILAEVSDRDLQTAYGGKLLMFVHYKGWSLAKPESLIAVPDGNSSFKTVPIGEYVDLIEDLI